MHFPTPPCKTGRKGMGKGKLKLKLKLKENWATPFPSKSAGRQGRSRQGRDIPSCPLQPTTPRTVWPWDREQTLRLVAQHSLPPSYPPWHRGEGTGGLGMPSAASAQLWLCLLEWETVPCPQGTVRVSKAETLHSYEGTSGINNQCQQRNSKGNVPLQQISTYVPHEKVSPLFLNGNNKKVYLILPEQ